MYFAILTSTNRKREFCDVGIISLFRFRILDQRVKVRKDCIKDQDLRTRKLGQHVHQWRVVGCVVTVVPLLVKSLHRFVRVVAKQ